MSRSRKLPAITHHKPSGLARVRLSGRDVYLGPWGTPAAEAEYRRVIAEWLASGVVPTRRIGPAATGTMTVGELARAYKAHLLQRMTEQQYKQTVRPALVRLDRLYGHTHASEFSASSLDAFMHTCTREELPRERKLSRGYLNKTILSVVKRLFKWAAHPQRKHVAASVWHDLCTIEPVKPGTINVPELPPVLPVSDDVVDATLAHLESVIRDMVQVQRLTGMRPGEVCALNLAEIDRSDVVWIFRPAHHKTAHFGKAREIPIGPKAQTVLMKYLNRPADAPVFSPADAAMRRKLAARAARRSKVTPSQLARLEETATNPRRKFLPGYTTKAYRLAITRGAKRAFRPAGMTDAEFDQWECPQHWHPNQLRHTRATEIRRKYGLDGAGAVLGHAKIETTQIYAERNRELATSIALATG